MKTQEEIQLKLDDYIAEYESIKDWHEQASKKYQSDKEFWGKDQADTGEMDDASSELSKCGSKIRLLKWILNVE